ncbi:MAG: YbhB/YbcL family Raf kinase inhibitor-like protein [Limisphaerales bacterium]
MNLFFAAMLFGCLLSASCSDGPKFAKESVMNIEITSAAFSEGGLIPQKYTCQGDDISPPLKWAAAPPNTKSFTLICEDPDAPTGAWTHWVIYNLPPNVTELSENVPKTETISGGAKQGLNSFKKIGYGGPCPPAGKPHRYFFKMYALDAMLNLKSGVTKKELLKAMNGHVLAEGQLMGTYQRK